MATTNTAANTQKLDMKSGRNMCPISEWAAAKGYKKADVTLAKTATGKLVKRLVFDGLYKFKISPKAYDRIVEGEMSILDLQYAEYNPEGDPNTWVVLFVPMGSKIVETNTVATVSFE